MITADGKTVAHEDEEMDKAATSRAYGNSYLVFDRDGNEFATIRNRTLSKAMKDASDCGGEIWLKGKCVVPPHNVEPV